MMVRFLCDATCMLNSNCRRAAMFFTDGSIGLVKYATTKIERHAKVRSAKSPYDGDWLYWGA
jgi:hypothetical protein